MVYLPSPLAGIKQFKLVKKRIANRLLKEGIVENKKVTGRCLIGVVSRLSSSRTEICHCFTRFIFLRHYTNYTKQIINILNYYMSN